MKTTRTLYRCHGVNAQAHAKQSADVIKGYFSLWSKRVTLIVEEAELDLVIGVHPYDVKITTADKSKEDVAHALGWAYLAGLKDGTNQFKSLWFHANSTFHGNKQLAEELRELKTIFQ